MPDIVTEIKIDDHGAIDLLAGYKGAQGTAMARALTRTGQWARTRTVKAVTSNLAVKAKYLDGSHRYGGVTASRASAGNLKANVKISGGRIPLFQFGGRPTTPPKRASTRGITYALYPGGGRRRIADNAFVATMKSGHTGFFFRADEGAKTKTARIRLGEYMGPSIPHVADHHPDFRKLIAVDAGEHLATQVEREVNFILTGSSKGKILEEGAANA